MKSVHKKFCANRHGGKGHDSKRRDDVCRSRTNRHASEAVAGCELTAWSAMESLPAGQTAADAPAALSALPPPIAAGASPDAAGEDPIAAATQEFCVDHQHAGLRLDQALEHLLPHMGLRGRRRCAENGGVSVNGRAAKASRRMRQGDVVRLHNAEARKKRWPWAARFPARRFLAALLLPPAGCVCSAGRESIVFSVSPRVCTAPLWRVFPV